MVSNHQHRDSKSRILKVELTGNKFFGVLDGIRTNDIRLRRKTLYPVELREQDWLAEEELNFRLGLIRTLLYHLTIGQ